MKKNISTRFKIQYNDMYQNYNNNIQIDNNNFVFMQSNMNKNISSSKLELLKQTYLLKENLKKEKLLFSIKKKEENPIFLTSDIQDDNEIIDLELDLDLSIINLPEEINNQYHYLESIHNIKKNDNDIDNNFDIIIDPLCSIHEKNECNIINLNETTVFFQEKIL